MQPEASTKFLKGAGDESLPLGIGMSAIGAEGLLQMAMVQKRAPDVHQRDLLLSGQMLYGAGVALLPCVDIADVPQPAHDRAFVQPIAPPSDPAGGCPYGP